MYKKNVQYYFNIHRDIKIEKIQFQYYYVPNNILLSFLREFDYKSYL